jgi:hypothetical protein
MAGFQISDAMYVGYYDFETTRLNNYNSGSHEIFLRYELFKNNDKITTNDSSKNNYEKKTYSLHNYYKCFSLNIYSQKARVATADKKI